MKKFFCWRIKEKVGGGGEEGIIENGGNVNLKGWRERNWKRNIRGFFPSVGASTRSVFVFHFHPNLAPSRYILHCLLLCFCTLPTIQHFKKNLELRGQLHAVLLYHPKKIMFICRPQPNSFLRIHERHGWTKSICM